MLTWTLSYFSLVFPVVVINLLLLFIYYNYFLVTEMSKQSGIKSFSINNSMSKRKRIQKFGSSWGIIHDEIKKLMRREMISKIKIHAQNTLSGCIASLRHVKK